MNRSARPSVSDSHICDLSVSRVQQKAQYTIRTIAILLVLGFLGWCQIACDDSADSPQKNKGADIETSDNDTKMDTDTETETLNKDTAGDVMPEFDCSPKDDMRVDGDADELFDRKTIPTFDIYLPPNAFEALKQDARDEVYIPVQGCFEGETLGEIGMRFKGGFGSLYYCFDENDRLICPKLSIKLKFNKYDNENRFYGLKRLNFQGYTKDESYIREKIAYDLYREMGITAPRAHWAQIRVNGELQGLFGMVEQVDGRLTADRFPDAPDGNLYKEVWPSTSDEETIKAHLKTNKDEGDVSAFKSFAEALNSADDSELNGVLGQYMDLEKVARYMAVDDAIFNVDGVTAFYEADSIDFYGNHNYYIYEAAPDHFELIPWDEDATLGMRQGFGGVPRWNVKNPECDARYPAWSGVHQALNPNCDPFFKAVAQDPSHYLAAVDALLAGPFQEDALIEKIDTYVELIKDAVKADPNNQGFDAFELSVARLKQRIPRLISRMTHFATGETIERFNLDFDTVHDFESLDELSLWTGIQVEVGANVDSEVYLNTETPLNGNAGLKLDFDFGNNLDSWGQWMAMQLVPLGGFQDISDLTGVRFVIRADARRLVRVDIPSPYETDLIGGVAFGYDVVATEEPQEIELLFEDAKIPSWAVDPLDDLADTLAYMCGLRIAPQCAGRDNNGFLKEGTRDIGYIEMDDIEFF